MAEHSQTIAKNRILADPAGIRALTGSVRFAWIWLVLRIYLGWEWLVDGWAKMADPAWMDGGTALHDSWARAIEAQPATSAGFDWYRRLLQYLIDSGAHAWLAPAIAVSETLLGIALILGILTGASALAGSLLNVNIAAATPLVVNPLTFALAIVLVLSWKTAGWIGLDHWLLPMLGAPWDSGLIFRRRTRSAPEAAPARSSSANP